jgi:hypothetical protein
LPGIFHWQGIKVGKYVGLNCAVQVGEGCIDEGLLFDRINTKVLTAISKRPIDFGKLAFAKLHTVR